MRKLRLRLAKVMHSEERSGDSNSDHFDAIKPVPLATTSSWTLTFPSEQLALLARCGHDLCSERDGLGKQEPLTWLRLRSQGPESGELGERELVP